QATDDVLSRATEAFNPLDRWLLFQGLKANDLLPNAKNGVLFKVVGLVGSQLDVDAIEASLIPNRDLSFIDVEGSVSGGKVTVTRKNGSCIATDGYRRPSGEFVVTGLGAVGTESRQADAARGRRRRDLGRYGSGRGSATQLVSARGAKAIARWV